MRSLLALLLVLPAALAGCLASDPVAPSESGAGPEPLPAAAPHLNVVVDPEGGMGEPSLGVTPDGVLFTNGPLGEGMGVYRSADNGTTWELLGDPTAPLPNFDPDLAVDADGTVWADVLYIGCNAVAVSRDVGESWSMHPVVCNGPVGDRQYVIPTKSGTAYLYYHQLPTFQQTAMKTTDYGVTWLPTGPAEGILPHHLLVNGGSGWGGGGFWNPVTDSVYFTYTWFEGGNFGGTPKPGYSVTRDGGLTWEVGTAAEAWGSNIGLGLVVGAADEAGNVYLAWGEHKDGDVAIFLVASKDDGVTWGKPVRIDTGTGSKVFPAIAAGPAGKVAVAYYESNEPGYPYEVSENAVWNVTLVWTEDALAEAPAVERMTFSDGPVRVGAICPDGSGCSSDRQFLDYFSIKRLPDGRVGGVWTSTADVEGETVNVYGATSEAILA